ncbi:MAG: GNAT family N-acetyltransferase [Desulfobulbaceae bacterium]|nr:GNAT family N-acetyltransferase [Desulfobulbaceae bacterium]
MKETYFRWCRLEDLTGPEVHALLAAREAVFVVEQNCPYQEADQFDKNSWHLIGYNDAVISCYLRVIDPGYKYSEPSIGRVLTSKSYRGTGLGRKLTEVGIARTQSTFPAVGIRMSAQAYLRDFYESFGFRVVSDEYMEDDIPHIEMLREA